MIPIQRPRVRGNAWGAAVDQRKLARYAASLVRSRGARRSHTPRRTRAALANKGAASPALFTIERAAQAGTLAAPRGRPVRGKPVNTKLLLAACALLIGVATRPAGDRAKLSARPLSHGREARRRLRLRRLRDVGHLALTGVLGARTRTIRW